MKPTSDHSFPDAEITSWCLSNVRLEIEVSDVFYAEAVHGPAKLVFPLDRRPSAMSYNHTTNHWTEEDKIEPLREICEFHHKHDFHYSLQGFGAESGRWLTIGIISGNAEITW